MKAPDVTKPDLIPLWPWGRRPRHIHAIHKRLDGDAISFFIFFRHRKAHRTGNGCLAHYSRQSVTKYPAGQSIPHISTATCSRPIVVEIWHDGYLQFGSNLLDQGDLADTPQVSKNRF